MSRVAVVDIGTNSTRLLIADVDAGVLTEIERESIVTRLGEGVDRTGALAEPAQARVFEVLDRYSAEIQAHGAVHRTAVMTSAVRDASNGETFAAAVRERFHLDARTLSGDEEARLTYLGATQARDPHPEERLLVIDIGGGSTELVVGSAGEVDFHVSTQVGVVRHTERHLHSDPPTAGELRALSEEVGEAFAGAVPDEGRERVSAAIAVAGTATQCARMDIGAAVADVEGHRLSAGRLGAMLDELASVPLEQRRAVPGLDPDRAPTIVAGIVVLTQALRRYGLDEVQISDRDILWGTALVTARSGPST